jgi:hypothetical protein
MVQKKFWGRASLFLSLSMAFAPGLARAQQSRLDSASAKSKIYLLTATYGVVAGSLVGLGSLAFYDKPSEKTRNIAMGASIGLYVGLLLGAYMIYGGEDPNDKKSSPGGAPGKSGPVLEDPLRLGVATPVEPAWAPYVTYDETRQSILAGVSFVY